MFVSDGKIHCFEEDRVVTVVLIHMLCHLCVRINSFDLYIDVVEEGFIVDGRPKELEYLEYFDLKPRTGRHVVIIVLCVLCHVIQTTDQLRKETRERLSPHNLDCAFEESTGRKKQAIIIGLQKSLETFDPNRFVKNLLLSFQK